MMTGLHRQLIPVGAALFLSANLYAGNAADTLQVQDLYARAVPPGQPNSAAFMTLTNKDATDHALIGAESAASTVVELHTHLHEDGMMKMRRVEQIDLPAGQTVKLQPGGLHVMLIGLEKRLAAGETLGITLVFADGSRAPLTAPIMSVQQTMQRPH